jgi:hypothetical protein
MFVQEYIVTFQIVGALALIAILLAWARSITKPQPGQRQVSEITNTSAWMRITPEVKLRHYVIPGVGVHDAGRDVKIFRIDTERHPEADRKFDLFCLTVEGRNYPVFCYEFRWVPGPTNGSPDFFLERTIENDLQDPFQPAMWPESNYPISPISDETERRKLIELALEALCFYGIAGNGADYLPDREFCASYKRTRKTILDYL